MSKSRGNIVRPTPIVEVMGVDALRYFLLREIVFGQDGSFSFDALVGRYNSDLANGLGNLASRTLNMIQQYFAGRCPESAGDADVARAAEEIRSAVEQAYEKFDFSKALERIWALIGTVDKFIVERAPWKLAKSEDEAARERLRETIFTAAEALRVACVLVSPVLPHSAANILKQLGVAGTHLTLADARWGAMPLRQIDTIIAVFPRLDAKPSIQKMQELEEVEKNRQATVLGKPAEAAAGSAPEAKQDFISIDDFSKIDLRVGEVKFAEAVKGADKLLHLKIDIGEAEPRTIVAGIALKYKPEEMIGRKVVIVANLAPRKLRGLTSQGMIVAASLEGGLPVLAGFHEDVPVGARLK